MNINDLTQLKKWFLNYVAGYYTGDAEYDRPIRLKEEHTDKVCENILLLCNGLDLTKQDLILAETIALCHDIGRFEQYARYGTFNDATSENHAQLGLKEMGKHSILSQCTTEEKRLISKSVAYHNVPSLGDNHRPRDALFMRLIRDADKLDVWRVLIDYYRNRDKRPNSAIELDLPDSPVCSQEILDPFCWQKPALLKDAKSVYDVILLQISWVFDLNFTKSFQMVQELKIVDQLNGFLPSFPPVRSAVEQAKSHVEKNIRERNGL